MQGLEEYIAIKIHQSGSKKTKITSISSNGPTERGKNGSHLRQPTLGAPNDFHRLKLQRC